MPRSTTIMSALVPSRRLTARALYLSRALLLLPPRTAMQRAPASTLSKDSKASPASASAVPKGRLLEKPARFNPPSHAARLPRRGRQQTAYQVPLSSKEKAQQKVRSYPHMMPPEGTFLHWFLTNRNIHVWITMVCFLPFLLLFCFYLLLLMMFLLCSFPLFLDDVSSLFLPSSTDDVCSLFLPSSVDVFLQCSFPLLSMPFLHRPFPCKDKTLYKST
jgi:hypothetical protein